MSKRITVKSMTFLAIMIALNIILARFLSIQTQTLKIGFSFVPVVLTAMLFGPLEAGMVAAIADIIGAMLFPIGAYFPGFTLTALCTGILYGIFLKKISTFRIVTVVFIIQVAGSLFMNTYWISVLYGSPFWPLFTTRIYQAFIMFIVHIVGIYFISKSIVPVLKRYM